MQYLPNLKNSISTLKAYPCASHIHIEQRLSRILMFPLPLLALPSFPYTLTCARKNGSLPLFRVLSSYLPQPTSYRLSRSLDQYLTHCRFACEDRTRGPQRHQYRMNIHGMRKKKRVRGKPKGENK